VVEGDDDDDDEGFVVGTVVALSSGVGVDAPVERSMRNVAPTNKMSKITTTPRAG
jgi:hypothetical protein